mmetsp:Transcript_1913/g.2678  ORF Transcript_1913/g.2678 Transcript_1913/m.2678 type:complete len:112 (+) Transcript_1913:84-419(+)
MVRNGTPRENWQVVKQIRGTARKSYNCFNRKSLAVAPAKSHFSLRVPETFTVALRKVPFLGARAREIHGRTLPSSCWPCRPEKTAALATLWASPVGMMKPSTRRDLQSGVT